MTSVDTLAKKERQNHSRKFCDSIENADGEKSIHLFTHGIKVHVQIFVNIDNKE